jgi:hypothetical protein
MTFPGSKDPVCRLKCWLKLFIDGGRLGGAMAVVLALAS